MFTRMIIRWLPTVAIALWLLITPRPGLAAPLAQAGQIYLPIINGGGNSQPTPVTPTTTVTPTPVTPTPVAPTPATPSPVSPFATLLTEASERCQATGVNQACLLNGAVAGFDHVGATIDVAPAMTLSVRSTLSGTMPSDLTNWSVLLIRLQAPGNETLTQTVDLIAMGNVDVAVQQLFTSTQVALGLPVVRFVSQPLQNGDQRAPSGLILQNRSEEELLSIDVNGAGITLDGAAFLLTQPAGKIQAAELRQASNEMVMSVRQGSAVIQVADQASAVVAGTQVAVALNAQGVANAAPSQAEASADDDLLIPLVPSPQETFDRLFSEAFTSIFECTEFKYPSRVYRMYYYLRQLNTTKMRSFLSAENWAKFADQVKHCARFEVIFDSTITGNTTITWRDQVHSDGTFIQFDINGDLVTEASSPLKHLQVAMSVPVCQLQSISKPDGTFAVKQASLRIHYNTMKIAMKTFPYMTLEQIPTGHFICPHPAPPLNVPIEWNTMFIQLHPELWLPQPIYVLQEAHWKYTGRQIFAEAIFADRSVPFADGMIESDSYFILRHAPVK